MGQYYFKTMDLLKKTNTAITLETAYHWISKLQIKDTISYDDVEKARTNIYNIILGTEHLVAEKMIVDVPVVYGLHIEEITVNSARINYGIFGKLNLEECALQLFSDKDKKNIIKTVNLPLKFGYQSVLVDELTSNSTYYCMIIVVQEGDPEYGGSRSVNDAELKFETQS